MLATQIRFRRPAFDFSSKGSTEKSCNGFEVLLFGSAIWKQTPLSEIVLVLACNILKGGCLMTLIVSSSKTVADIDRPLTNSIKQAAVRSGLSERSLWAAIAQHKLNSIRIGGRVLIPENALRSFLGLKEDSDEK